MAFTMAPCRRLRFNLSDLYPVPRLGIAQLAAILRAQGHHVCMADLMATPWSTHRFAEWVEHTRADLLAVSTTILSVREAFALCRAARRLRPGLRTVVGGPGVGGWLPEELVRYADGAVDYFVRGEGEVALPALVSALASGGALDDVPGLVFRAGTGATETARARPIPLDDALPGPAWDLMPMDAYRLHPPMGVYPYATLLETARGCGYPCNFCCLAGPYRARSPEWVAGELARLRAAYALREVHFVDPTFTHERARTLAMCEELAGLPFRLRWTCKTRVDRIDAPLAAAMARAGCYAVSFGVESGADGMLASMNKRAESERTREAFRICRAHGIRTVAYCMVAGPGETDATVDATIRFVREIRADYALYGIVDADPANALTRRAVSEGRLSRRDVAELYLGDSTSALHTETVSGAPLEVARGWLRRASTDFYLRPAYAWGRIRDLRTLQDARNLAAGGAGFVRDLLQLGTTTWRRAQ